MLFDKLFERNMFVFFGFLTNATDVHLLQIQTDSLFLTLPSCNIHNAMHAHMRAIRTSSTNGMQQKCGLQIWIQTNAFEHAMPTQSCCKTLMCKTKCNSNRKKTFESINNLRIHMKTTHCVNDNIAISTTIDTLPPQQHPTATLARRRRPNHYKQPRLNWFCWFQKNNAC